MWLTLGVCIPAVMALALAVEFFIAPLFYEGYVNRNTVPEGAAGSASAQDTPVASSIADMERLTDGFTFLTSGTVLNHDTARVGETVYHYIKLDSGEKVFARINKKALTDTQSVGIYRLPVGIWREWTLPEELVESYLAGFRAWVDRTGRDGAGNMAFRREIYERLKRQSFSPYSIAWNTDLSWLPGVSGGERTVTKRLLKHYRGDF